MPEQRPVFSSDGLTVWAGGERIELVTLKTSALGNSAFLEPAKAVDLAAVLVGWALGQRGATADEARYFARQFADTVTAPLRGK